MHRRSFMTMSLAELTVLLKCRSWLSLSTPDADAHIKAHFC